MADSLELNSFNWLVGGVHCTVAIALRAFILSLYSNRVLVESILANIHREVENELRLALEPVVEGMDQIALDEEVDRSLQR